MIPSEGAIQARIGQVNNLMAGHVGAIELVEISENGAVKVRFKGMCTGCPFRPLTMAATVRPALTELDGVTAVDVEGGRISEEAAQRLESYMAAAGPSFHWRATDRREAEQAG